MMTIQVLGNCRCTSRLTTAQSVSRSGRAGRGGDAVAGCIELAPNQDKERVVGSAPGRQWGPGQSPISKLQCNAKPIMTELIVVAVVP